MTSFKSMMAAGLAVAWLALSALSYGSLYSNIVTDDNPVGYWRLNETTGGTATDQLGANPGQYLNGVALGRPGALAGDADKAAGFDGTDDKVDIPWSASLNPSTVSFECWAKVAPGTDSTHRSPISSRDGTPGAEGYIFYAEAGKWQFWSGPGWDNLSTSSTSVVQDQWTHLVGTYDAVTKTKNLYVDGKLAASKTNVTITPNDARPLRIGAGQTEGTGTYWFRGDIDEVAVYNQALSPGQVATHYAVGMTGVLPMADGPVYHFDESAGSLTRDATNAHADGTISGATWATGKFGSGLSFDGVDDRVTVSAFPAGLYPELTVEAWVNLGDKQGRNVLLNEQQNDSLWVNFDTYGAETFDVYLGDTTVKAYHSSTATIPRGAWTHVAFTYSDPLDQLKLYINGQLDRTVATSGVLNFDGTISLGIREDLAGDSFKGLLDEVAIYRRALSATEIQSRFLGGPPIPTPEPSSLAMVILGGLGLLVVCHRSRRLSLHCSNAITSTR